MDSNIVELSSGSGIITELTERLSFADMTDRKVRLLFGTDDRGVTFFKYAIGGDGMWSLPIYDEA